MRIVHRTDTSVLAAAIALCQQARQAGLEPRVVALGFDAARAVIADMGPMFAALSRVAADRIRPELQRAGLIEWVEDPDLPADSIEVRES